MDYESAADLAPTPSYALESSDGESDYEDELPPSSRVTRKPAPAPEVEVTFSGATDKLKARGGGEAVFLVGEAGERMAQGVALASSGEDDEETVSVLVDGEQAGLIATATDCTLVFLSTALPLAALYPLAARVLELLQPDKVTVIASYHLPSYIPPSGSTPTPPLAIAPPVLYLASSPSPSSTVTKLASNGTVQAFTPPNLLHGLPAALMTLSSTTLADSVSDSTLWLLPTTTPPPPLNGPFPPTSPITNHGGSASSTMYDAGGPTGLGEPNALFRQVAGSGSGGRGGRGSLQAIKELESWSWWDPSSHGGKGFAWVERQRRLRRKSELSSMYM
ncbi:hypothetical protein JCM8115_005303 [Rhodotorula mucilaginosa]